MMTFTESIKTCLKKYFDTRGRATRAEYWWFQLLWWMTTVFCAVMATAVESVLGEGEGVSGVILALLALWALFFLFTLIPNFCVCARRLQDTGWSSYTFIWCIFCLWLGLLIINIRNMFPSDDDNEYGANPFHNNDVEARQSEKGNEATNFIEKKRDASSKKTTFEC